MSWFRTRRVDGAAETEADQRFFALREAGYTGPIDQDGNPSLTGPDAEILRHLHELAGGNGDW